MPAYPSSIFPWVNRVNNTNIVWANDPNSIVSELQSVESVLGLNPQVETGINFGPPVTYPTVSARIAAANQGLTTPYAILANQTAHNIGSGKTPFETFLKIQDQYNFFNGSDVTAPANGVYLVWHNEKWDTQGQRPSGIVGSQLLANGGDLGTHWNRFDYTDPDLVFDTIGFTLWTGHFWMGQLHQGDRLQIKLYNATNVTMTIDYSTLRCIQLRVIPTSTQFLTG